MILMAVLCLSATVIYAQKFTKAFSNPAGAKRVVIETDKMDVTVIGYEGKEVAIEGDGDYTVPERAKGLRPLYSNAQDNTGIGLEISESNNVITIKKAVSKDASYTVKIPADAALKIEERDWTGSDIIVRSLKGEIEVKGFGADVTLEDVTGPVTANSTSGDIKVVFSQVSQAAPTTISNISGSIDVAIPAATKADLKLEAISGEIYTDLDIKMKDGMKQIGGSRITSSLNGGGVEISLKAISDDIYLRKK
jgi:DUF4097 and DUF4098 domain-containing protein YvlB